MLHSILKLRINTFKLLNCISFESAMTTLSTLLLIQYPHTPIKPQILGYTEVLMNKTISQIFEKKKKKKKKKKKN